jgi:hypothetical protein
LRERCEIEKDQRKKEMGTREKRNVIRMQRETQINFVLVTQGLWGSWREKGGAVRGVGAFVPRCFLARFKCHHFVPGRIRTRYKCVILTFVPVGATTRYKCEAFVPVGLEEALTRSCEGAFVPGDGSTQYKCYYL